MTMLAEMTPEQRAQCVGMWATVATERYMAVIARTFMADDVQIAHLIAPEINDYYTANLESITPRPDLPRAWGADGKPVPMFAEYANLDGPRYRHVTEWEKCQ